MARPKQKSDDLSIWCGDAIHEDFGRDILIGLVGNGPVDRSDAAALDECDVIVRFNNWGSRSGEIKDKWLPIIGGRCDIALGNFDCHSTNIGRDGITAPKQAVLGIPYPHRWKDADTFYDRFYPEARPCMINPFWNRDLCAELGYENEGWKHPLPTVGLTAMYHLNRMVQAGQLQAHFFVCGFTWHYNAEKDTIQDVPITTGRLPGHFNHFYHKEAWWVSNRLYGNGSRWTFGAISCRPLNRLNNADYSWMLLKPS